MRKRHFVAVYTDSGFMFGCPHEHHNVITATACISEPGGYVVAVCKGEFMELTDAEEAEFQSAMYGRGHLIKRALGRFLLIMGKLETQI